MSPIAPLAAGTDVGEAAGVAACAAAVGLAAVGLAAGRGVAPPSFFAAVGAGDTTGTAGRAGGCAAASLASGAEGVSSCGGGAPSSVELHPVPGPGTARIRAARTDATGTVNLRMTLPFTATVGRMTSLKMTSLKPFQADHQSLARIFFRPEPPP